MGAFLRRLAVPLVLAPVFASTMCAAPTEIDVEVWSEIPCDKRPLVGLVVGGDLKALGAKGPSTTSSACDRTSGRVGSVVIVPSGDETEEVSFQIVTRNDDGALESCTEADGYKGCIVARRTLHFEPHETLKVRVDLRLACLDRPCEPTETCAKGACVSPQLSDCSSQVCTEDQLKKGDSDAGTSEAGPDASSGTDAGTSCALPPPQKTLSARAIVDVPLAIDGPTGFAQQTHVLFAQNDCRFWYFYFTADGTQIQTMVSKDLVTWEPGSTLTIPDATVTTGIHGANFSVATNVVDGRDVVHLVLSSKSGGSTFHLRAEIQDGKLSAPSLAKLFKEKAASNLCEIDCPVTVVGPDGHVYDATGFASMFNGQTNCDMDVYQSTEVDPGGAWTPSFAQSGYFVTVPGVTGSHQLVPLPGAKTVMGAWADHQQSGSGLADQLALGWSASVIGYQQGQGSQPVNLLFDNTQGRKVSNNDWALCRLNGDEVHALRHITVPASPDTPNELEFATYDGATFQVASPPPALASAGARAGLVLLSDANPDHGMIAFVLDADRTTIRYARYTRATGWDTTWSSFPGTTVPGTFERDFLAGSGCGSVRPTLFWVENDNASAHIVGMDVSSLFQN